MVDVLISTYNEEGAVDSCLDAVLAQTVPVAVTVVDGGSADGTVARLQERAARDERLTVIADGERRTLPAALNLALARTTRPFVAKVDARTFLASDFIERALAVIDECGESTVAAGGSPEQFGDTPFGAALARARTSRFGVGASGYADYRPRAEVDTVQCGVYRRAALERIGGFDPDLQFGEDEELNWRLRRDGGRLIRDASIRFRYLTRPSWRLAFRQYRNYGRARVAVVLRHPGYLRPHHLIPSLAVAGAAVLGAGSLVMPRARLPALVLAASYALGAGAAAALAGARRREILDTVAAFSALHAGYGIGMLEALLATSYTSPWRNRSRALPDTAPSAPRSSGSDTGTDFRPASLPGSPLATGTN